MTKEIKEINKFWGKFNKIDLFKKNISDAAIGQKIGVNNRAVQKIRYGDTSPYLFRIVQIAEVLSCKPSELLPDAWQTNNKISVDDFKLITDIFDIIDIVEKNKNVRLPNGLRSRIFIALFLMVKEQADNDNQQQLQEELINYSCKFLDNIINQ